MTQTRLFPEFIDIVRDLLEQKKIIKITLSKKNSKSLDLKNVFIKPVLIKNIVLFNTVYRYKTKDITKNLTALEVIAELKKVLSRDGGLINCDIFSPLQHIHAIIHKNHETVTLITHQEIAIEKSNALSEHNKIKNRAINPNNEISKIYLKELGLIESNGQVIPSMQHKYKQINKYVEILQPYIDNIHTKSDTGEVYDIGSGKGYLSFTLADYCLQNNTKKVDIKGIEMRQDMVDKCNNIVSLSKITNLTFETGNISNYFQKQILLDVVVALHACDTATDEAIFMGIKNDASLIVVAPCCHRQIRKNIIENKNKSEYHFLKHIIKHGILLERQAEYITDTIRALLLEIHGYKVRVMEFINLENTPKNILIIATKRKESEVNTKETDKLKIDLINLKTHFGVTEHYLEGLLEIV
jgi:SAM-dependent methyltransferase